MDNLTHSLVGLLLSRAAMPRALPRKVWLGVAAANAPDLDLIVSLTPAAYLIAHRHVTHAVVAIPLMAACAVALVWALDRLWRQLGRAPASELRLGAAWLAALAPAASHPLLDWTNAYAIRPWLPFDNAWSSANLFFVVEPWLWVLLGLAAAAPIYWGARPTAALGLASLLGYAVWQTSIREAALGALADQQAERIAVFPAPLDASARIAYMERDGARWVGAMRSASKLSLDPESLIRFDRPAEREAVEAAWSTPLGRAYRQFSLYPLEIVKRTDAGWTVTLGDARFVRSQHAGFACVVELDRDGRAVSERFAFGGVSVR